MSIENVSVLLPSRLLRLYCLREVGYNEAFPIKQLINVSNRSSKGDGVIAQ
jgi:hypothetical protein